MLKSVRPKFKFTSELSMYMAWPETDDTLNILIITPPTEHGKLVRRLVSFLRGHVVDVRSCKDSESLYSMKHPSSQDSSIVPALRTLAVL